MGREDELERLRALLRAARDGESSAVVVHGEPGSGKTTLLRAALAESDGLTVLAAEGVESESDLPYSGLAELLAPIQELRDRIPAPQRQALERALALSEGDVRDRFAVGAATVSLLGAAAERAPVLCAIDDAQWTDLASLEAVRFAARRLEGIGVVVILVARGDDEPAVDAAGLETLRIGPLPMAAAQEIVSRAADGRLDTALVDQIVATAGGNPLALVEIAASLASGQLSGGPAEPLPPGRTAQELFAERVAALPERARLGLLVVAAAGEERVDRARAALSHVGLDLAELEVAEELRLVEIEGGRLRFRHPLIRSAAYHTAAVPARRRAHAAVAATLPPGDRRLPWHVAAATAEPDEEVAALMEQAAKAARGQGGYHSAARAQQRAATLTPDPETQARRLLVAAEDLQVVGESDKARDLVQDATRLTQSAPIHALGLALRGDIELRQGSSALAHEVLREAADRLEGQDVLAGVLLMKAAFAAVLAGDVDAWRADAGRAQVLLSEAGAPLVSLAQALVGIADVTGGRRGGGAALAASVDPDALPGLLRSEELPRGGTAEIHTFAADAWIWLEQWDRASALLDGLVTTLRDLAAVSTLIYPLFARARLDFHLGRWDTALAGVSEAVDLGTETNHSAPLVGALYVRALIRAARGDVEGCREDASRGLELSQRVASPIQIGYIRHALGLLALGSGDMDDAIEQLDLARRDWHQTGIVEPGALPFIPDLAEALGRAGRAAEAVEAIGDYEARASAADRPLASAAAARIRGLLAPDESFDEPFRRALALQGSLHPFARARTLLAYGERLRRARRLTESRVPLREALRLFEQLAADPWARRARTELRATGAAVPTETPALFAVLTAHEVQVAQLVAEGRTNREIAAALFIAPKTVEHHLSRVFRKLGIRRRAELAALAADLRPGVPQR